MKKALIIFTFLCVILSGCVSTIDMTGKSEAEVKKIRLAEISASYTTIGNKITQTKLEIIHQCTTNLLVDEAQCNKLKIYYNYISDVFYAFREVPLSAIDEENSKEHINNAINELSLILINNKYPVFLTESISNLINVLNNDSLNNIQKSDEILKLIEIELIKMIENEGVN